MENNIADVILNDERPQGKPPLIKRQTANLWIKEAEGQPIPKMLFSQFWHEGELCFLFADTNLGKSILAVQIANAISKGENDSVFKVEAPAQKVLYFDFELSPKQFQNRYSADYKNPYQFSDNFIRCELDPNGMNVVNFEAALSDALEKSIIEEGAKVLVIDNITFLKTQSAETCKSRAN